MWVVQTTESQSPLKFNERCEVTQILYMVPFFVHCLNNCIHDHDTSTSMFFVNNYSVFVLSVTNMAFSGLHDADHSDPSILVLQDRHRSHFDGKVVIKDKAFEFCLKSRCPGQRLYLKKKL